jgi:hypothetical protein
LDNGRWFITSRRVGLDLRLVEGRVPVSRDALRIANDPSPIVKISPSNQLTALSSSPRRIIMLMAAITPTEAQAYFKRWELVKEIELVELRRTSMDVKLRQLSALMASRGLFGVDPERENGVQLVRDRWACLRQALRG